MTSRNPLEKSVAIKILKPLGYKILPFGQLSKCIVASKGQPLNQKQIHGKATLTADNLWWLVHPASEHVYAAYEDASRGQLRELTLPRCIEIWGWSPLGSDQLSPEVMEKRNLSGQTFAINNSSIVQLPTVAPKYLRWLQSRSTICREMNNMIHIGEHPNIVDLLEVLELIQDSKAVLFLGKCGGLKKKNELGDLILPIAAIRGEGTSNDYFPPEVPALPAFNLQKAISTTIRNHNKDYWTGTVYTTNRRVWEHDEEFKDYLRKIRVMGIDMECGGATKRARSLPLLPARFAMTERRLELSTIGKRARAAMSGLTTTCADADPAKPRVVMEMRAALVRRPRVFMSGLLGSPTSIAGLRAHVSLVALRRRLSTGLPENRF